MNQFNTAWTPERLGLLKELNDKGSNAWIALQINRQTNAAFTRNSIIGKRRREGLDAPNQFATRSRHPCVRKSSGPRKRRMSQEVDLLAMFNVAPPPQLDFLEFSFDQMAEDTRACRYPHGDKVPYLFCGQLTKDGSSYCTYHHSVTYDAVTTARAKSRKSENYLARL